MRALVRDVPVTCLHHANAQFCVSATVDGLVSCVVSMLRQAQESTVLGVFTSRVTVQV